MAAFGFARSSIARLALLHGTLLALAMVLVLAAVYVVTARIIAAEGDQLVMLETQQLVQEFHARDLDAFVTAIVDRAEDPVLRGGVYELRGPRGDFLAGNVVVLPEVTLQPGGWTEFDVTVSRRDEDAGRRVRARVTDLGGGFRMLVGHEVQDRRAFRDVMLRALAWAVLVTLLFGLAGGWWLGRRILAAGEMRELGRNSSELHREAGRLAAKTGKIDWVIGVAGDGDPRTGQTFYRRGQVVYPVRFTGGQFGTAHVEADDAARDERLRFVQFALFFKGCAQRKIRP
jgi:hypothetical protein